MRVAGVRVIFFSTLRPRPLQYTTKQMFRAMKELNHSLNGRTQRLENCDVLSCGGLARPTSVLISNPDCRPSIWLKSKFRQLAYAFHRTSACYQFDVPRLPGSEVAVTSCDVI